MCVNTVLNILKSISNFNYQVSRGFLFRSNRALMFPFGSTKLTRDEMSVLRT